LGKNSKFLATYCGPFEVFSRIGKVAYQLLLRANLKLHNVFHVSLLKKYAHDVTHIVYLNVIQVEPEGEFRVELLIHEDGLSIIFPKLRFSYWNTEDGVEFKGGMM
jgi:hypothetical protein